MIENKIENIDISLEIENCNKEIGVSFKYNDETISIIGNSDKEIIINVLCWLYKNNHIWSDVTNFNGAFYTEEEKRKKIDYNSRCYNNSMFYEIDINKFIFIRSDSKTKYDQIYNILTKFGVEIIYINLYNYNIYENIKKSIKLKKKRKEKLQKRRKQKIINFSNKNLIKDRFDIEFEKICNENPEKVKNALIRVLSLREFGNKLHGDTFEIVLNEMINIYFSNLKSCHIGKKYFRSKSFDADLVISKNNNVNAEEYAFIKNAINKIETSEITKDFLTEICNNYKQFNVSKIWKNRDYSELSNFLITLLNEMNTSIIEISLKCYGIDNIQLYTDANHEIFPYLSKFIDNKEKNMFISLSDVEKIKKSNLFKNKINGKKILILKYNENENNFSLLSTNMDNFLSDIYSIEFIPSISRQKGKYDIFKFYDINNNYIFEVRYGGKKANALQRGIWSDMTKNNGGNFIKLIDNEKYTIDNDYLNFYRKSFFLSADKIKNLIEFID
jgi:hypothetical protein